MPVTEVRGASINHEVTGSGEPLLLLPCLGADLSCWGFQVPGYSERYTCISVDLPGVGLSPPPEGAASTIRYADEMAALLDALGIASTHVAGVSLGSAVATHLAARHPERVRSLALHSTWDVTDAYMATVLDGWDTLVRAAPTVADAVVTGIFPWAFTAAMYAERPDVLEEFGAIARSRPPQSVAGFDAGAQAVRGHDAREALGRIAAPTLVTYGALDALTSTRFAPAMTEGIRDSRLHVFEGLSHAGFNEDPDRFTAVTLEFMASVGG
ncbi:MAG: alpha/beta fold hydrolase [Thermoleophilia bacterium]